LRGNPGGSLVAAVDIASQFLSGGIVLLQENADGQRTPFNARPNGLAPNVPLVVLVDKDTMMVVVVHQEEAAEMVAVVLVVLLVVVVAVTQDVVQPITALVVPMVLQEPMELMVLRVVQVLRHQDGGYQVLAALSEDKMVLVVVVVAAAAAAAAIIFPYSVV